jgi:CubicO group peptidase (beta-lactamase class C family)
VRRAAALALAFLATAAGAGDRDAPTDRIDAIVRAEMRSQKIPGMALAVVRSGGVVIARGYGSANLEHRVPVTRATIFQSGSLGKQFTAAIVMSLVEEGRLGLDDPVTKYLPDAPAAWSKITLRHLLTHTSGIADYDESGKDFDFRKDYTEEEMAKVLYGLPLEFEPGARWNYSNSGYMLLGIVIHRATGRYYGDLLVERILRPAGMRTARIISEADIVPNRAAGYDLVNGEIKNQDWVSPSLNSTADGALYFSLDDLLAWQRVVRTRGLLKPQSWAAIYTPATLNSGKPYPYGFGWFVDTAGGDPHIWHSGSWQGFKTYFARYHDDRLAVIVLANSGDAELEPVVQKVAAVFDPALGPLRPIADRDPQVTARLRDLLAATAAGNVDPGGFAFAPRGFFPDGLRANQEILQPLGDLRELRLLQVRDEGDDQVFEYVATYASRSVDVTLGLAPDRKISVFALQ